MLITEYGAKVFDCVTAQEYGYVDFANVTKRDAILALLEAANVDPSKTYQVVELEPKSEWLSDLLQSESPLFSGKIEHCIDTKMPEMRSQIAYLYLPLVNSY